MSSSVTNRITGKDAPSVSKGLCTGCYFKADCGGFRDREGRCPEWAAKDPRSRFYHREEELMNRLREQAARLGRMIAAGGANARTLDHWKTWKCQLEARIQQEEEPMTKGTKKGKRTKVGKDHVKNPPKLRLVDNSPEVHTHHWILKGNRGTCKTCGEVRDFSRKSKEDLAEARPSVLAYLRKARGKAVVWATMAKAMGLNPRQLGVVVKGLLDEGFITEPKQYHYELTAKAKAARPKAALRKAA